MLVSRGTKRVLVDDDNWNFPENKEEDGIPGRGHGLCKGRDVGQGTESVWNPYISLWLE